MWVRAQAEGVVIIGRRADRLEETASKLRNISHGTKILTVKTDLTVDADVENVYKQIQKTFGRPADVVLANAGAVDELANIADDPVDKWWKVHVGSSFPPAESPVHDCLLLVGDQLERRIRHNPPLYPLSAQPQRARGYNHQRQLRPRRLNRPRQFLVRDIETREPTAH